MRFGFLLKGGKSDAPQVAAQLAGILAARGCHVVLAEEDAVALPGAHVVPASALGASVDVLVILGGDGTFLRGASLVSDHGVPLLGINLGGLGFMAHYSLADARTALEQACDGLLPIDERMRLHVTLQASGQTTVVGCALNEVAISRSAARLLDLTAKLDGGVITTYKADGLILCTPTGSTAYNLAAGGPILTPDLEAIVLTPISAHTLTNRPVVVRGDAHITVTNVSTCAGTLTLDGQMSREFAPGDSLEARKASRPLRTFRPPNSFFSILRQKLSWGERQG